MGGYTRRYLLVAGTGTLVGLAGCSDSDTPESTPTETATPTAEPTPTPEPTPTTIEQPTSLDVENTVFCEEQPTGHQQYTEQPDRTYSPGDVVWLYLEPTTVGLEPAGEGQVRFEYDMSWTVETSEGEELDTLTDTATKTISESTDPSTVFLSLNFSPSTEFEPGTYTLAIEITDTIAGNTATETLEFEVESPIKETEGEFGISTFVFTEDEAQDYDEYTPKPDAEYGPTETVWYYYEIDGFAYEETSDALRPDLQITETLTGPEGDTWSEEDIPLDNKFEPSIDLDTYFITDNLAPSEDWLPGEYELRFELTDGHTDESVTETYTFTVVED